MIVAGFGFRCGTGLRSLQAAFELAQHGLPAVTHLATAEDKLGALAPLADALGLLLSGISPQAMAAATTLTQSAASLTARGIGSVAEASAMAAVGVGVTTRK